MNHPSRPTSDSTNAPGSFEHRYQVTFVSLWWCLLINTTCFLLLLFLEEPVFRNHDNIETE